MKETRIGVIGTGRIGKLHITNLTRLISGARVEAVADPLIDAVSDLLDELGIEKRYKDHRPLLESKDIDAIFICSPTDTHADLVTEAAAAGKHIFCEKPIDLTIKRAKAAVEAARAAGVMLQVGFNRRFDRNFARIAAGVTNGEIGTPHFVRISSRDPAPPPIEYIKRSGGIFLDMMIHDFDMAAFVAGSPISKVSSTGKVLVDPEIGKAGDIDTAVVTLEFENGALGSIDNSRRAAYGYDQRVEVFGTNGMLVAENDTPDVVRRFDENGEHRSKLHWFFLERYNQAFVEETGAFLRAITNGDPISADGVAGLNSILAAVAAKASLDRKRPVTIAEIIEEEG